MKLTKTQELSYRDHEGITQVIKGCSMSVDELDRHWIWSNQLQQNLCYKAKGRENALLTAIDILLCVISLRDERLKELKRIADLAEEFANKIKPDNQEEYN